MGRQRNQNPDPSKRAKGRAPGKSGLGSAGFRACVTTYALDCQRLKPHSLHGLYGTVETVPYKEYRVATQALKPVPQGKWLKISASG